MNEVSAANFINSLVKNLQVLCHSNVDFNQNIEVIGHLYLNIDSCKKINYIVNEKVCKNDKASTVFVSNSFHAEDIKKKSQPLHASNIQDECMKQTSIDSNRSSTRERGLNYGSDKFQHRHKRSMSSDTTPGSTLFKYSRKEISFNSPFQQSISPNYSPTSHASEKSGVDLSRVKQEPGGIKEEQSTQCLYSSRSNNKHVMLEQTTSKQQFYPSNVNSISVSDTGQSSNCNDFTNIIENAAELYPVEMLNIPHSAHQSSSSQANTVLPSISTLTSSRFGNPSLSSPASSSMLNLSYERHHLSLEDKLEIITAAESVDKPSQTALAFKFGVSQPAINRILKKKNIYLNKYHELNIHTPPFHIVNPPSPL